jgi:hypothetical protein
VTSAIKASLRRSVTSSQKPRRPGSRIRMRGSLATVASRAEMPEAPTVSNPPLWLCATTTAGCRRTREWSMTVACGSRSSFPRRSATRRRAHRHLSMEVPSPQALCQGGPEPSGALPLAAGGDEPADIVLLRCRAVRVLLRELPNPPASCCGVREFSGARPGPPKPRAQAALIDERHVGGPAGLRR